MGTLRRAIAVRIARNVSENGAPEEIRTPDPQIRSLEIFFDNPHYFCKPTPPCTTIYQWVAPCLQTEWGKPIAHYPELRADQRF